LVLLTDQPGLFTADPRKNPDARLIPQITKIDDAIYKLAGESVSGLGIGGMTTKIQAADVACRVGVEVVIAAGTEPDVIARIIRGESVGTRFLPLETPLESRKGWIFACPTSAGHLLIDKGAEQALCENNSSLLPSGITAVEGEFRRGDTVSILGAQHTELARGIVRYDSNDLNRIKGCHSDQIAERLGYVYAAVAIHRNDLILL
jgi:glutamate 5-kinase